LNDLFVSLTKIDEIKRLKQELEKLRQDYDRSQNENDRIIPIGPFFPSRQLLDHLAGKRDARAIPRLPFFEFPGGDADRVRQFASLLRAACEHDVNTI